MCKLGTINILKWAVSGEARGDLHAQFEVKPLHDTSLARRSRVSLIASFIKASVCLYEVSSVATDGSCSANLGWSSTLRTLIPSLIAGTAQSVYRLLTGWTTEGWNFESRNVQEFSLLHVFQAVSGVHPTS
jgi:hypothetical protein